nr:reverse transcriptase domain-containing protein [Tanacetum cinerariifolium]
MSRCRDNQKVKYTAGLFVSKAPTWWISQIYTRGREAIVGMSYKDFKTLTREEFCPSNEIQKLETELWNHAMVEAGHAAYTYRFHELARLVPHLLTPEETEPKTIQKAVQIAGTLTDEALRNGSIKKNPEKRENRGEPREKTWMRYPSVPPVTLTIYLRRPVAHVSIVTAQDIARDCRVVPRNVNIINVESGSKAKGNHQNQVVTVNEGQGRGNQGNQERGKAFMLCNTPKFTTHLLSLWGATS